MNDRIQLKQEEVVGNEVVLSDINPRTNTKSVDDSSTGTDLQQTIDRMWNTINNKLSRIVNSVNGRDSCVVITSEDVGLGNVDNVSFADIKQWVINRMDQEFGYKQLICFESLSDLNVWVGEHNNDAIYDMKPFYVHKWSDEDLRGYIGVFAYEGGLLNANHRMVIDTVGWTDNSIIYNEDVNETHYAGTGKMGVNIWKYEDALEIYDDLSGNKYDSGLRIKKESVVGSLYYFDGAYGTGEPDDSHALVYFDSTSLPVDPSALKSVEFYFNDVLLTTVSTIFLRQSFKIGDLILCDFCRKDNYYDANDIMKNGMISDLIDRYQHLGMVTTAPTMEHPENNYVIKFYAIKPKVSNGLTYKDETIEINPIKTYGAASDFSDGENISGLTTLSPHKDPSTNAAGEYEYMQMTPWGVRRVFSCPDAPDADMSAITINLADSLCMIPTIIPLGMNNSWPKDVDAGIYNNDPYSDRCDVGSAIGINLEKEIQTFGGYQGLFNMSGLRITSPLTSITGSWFGNDTTNVVSTHSGGVSVNVGDFLEIGHKNEFGDTKTIPSSDHSNEHYNWGKVNVRIDDQMGLIGNNNNAIGINIDAGNDFNKKQGGLHFVNDNTENNHKAVAVKVGPGMAITSRNSTGVIDTLKSVTVNIVDPITGSPDTYVLEHEETPYSYRWYGGLRYIRNLGASCGAIGIRINEDNAWDEGSGFMYGPSYIGSRGLTITHNNVLSIQLAQGFENGVSLETLQAIIEEKYDSIIFMPNPTEVYDRVEDFPQQGNSNTMYVSLEKGFKEHYIWNTADRQYQNMYVFNANISSSITGELNKIYVSTETDEHYEKITVKLYSWSYWFKTFLPAFGGKSFSDGNDATKILSIYSALSIGANEDDWSHEIMVRSDANQDGIVDGNDATMVIKFYAKTSASLYSSDIIGWRQFIFDEYHIGPDDRDDSHGWQLMYTTDVLPGLGSRINSGHGITTYHESIQERMNKKYQDRPSIGIAIHDSSIINSNYVPFNKFKSGGLRFATDGVLAVRVNKDNSTGYCSGDGGANDITRGSMGIGIDTNNVLGVQLTTNHDKDNGMLAIDKSGNLVISDSYRPSIDIEKPKPLYIGPSDDSGISYDGTNQETIILGPGLILVPDDTPDPEEEASIEDYKTSFKNYIDQLSIKDWVCYFKYVHQFGEEGVPYHRNISFFEEGITGIKDFIDQQESIGPLMTKREEFNSAEAIALDHPVEFGLVGYELTITEFSSNAYNIIEELMTNHPDVWKDPWINVFNAENFDSPTGYVKMLKNPLYYFIAVQFYNDYVSYLPSP